MLTCDLSIIIVSWNVWTLLAACLRSIKQVSWPVPGVADQRAFGPEPAPATLEVIVVDNASQDGAAEQLPSIFPWVRLIRSDVNLGFTKGNNHGYAASHGRFISFSILIQTRPRPDASPGRNAPPLPLVPPYDGLWKLFVAIPTTPRSPW